MRDQKTTFASGVLTLINALLVTCVLNFAAAAQTTSATDGSTPLALQPGAPSGSYALSGFDNVNLYNGNLNFQLSLHTIAGRGGAQVPILLPIEGKWRVSDIAIPQMDGSFIHKYLPIQTWWDNFDRKYMPGTLAGRQSGWDTMTCPDNTTIFTMSLTRLTFTGPDGTEYELRDQLTGGQPSNNGNCNNYLNPPSRGTVFVTSDGSAATFVSDAPIHDVVLGGNSEEIYPSGHLMLRDGTRFRIESGLARWLRDRNGNKLTFFYDANNRIQSVTDSLNRQITIARNTGPGTFDQITYKGFGGATRTIKVNYSSLANTLRSDYSSTLTYKALFPDLNGSTTSHHNPSVVSSITLPNNKQYLIKYNPHGEIARVVLPTGGAIEYDHAGGETTSSNGVCTGWEGSLVIYRRVVERRVYPDGGSGSTYASRSTYSLSQSVGTNASYVITDQLSSSGTLLARSKHYFHGRPWLSFNLSPIDYPGWKDGREYQTEEFASNGTTILRRTENTWQQRLASGWWGAGSDASPANDPRLSETKTTLVDTNQVSKQTFTYDDTVPFNNRSDVYEYNFGNGAPGSLVRRTHTDYLKTNPVNSTNYTTNSIHIRSLPTQTQVFDGAGVEKARTTFEYDNYASTPLEPRSNISGHDAAFTTLYVTRGNLTRSTGWILSTSTQLHSYIKYDVAGNVVKAIDARGYETTFEFADRYGAPDTEAQGNTAPSELGGQTSYAFATKVTNAAGHFSFAQFDYHLGKVVNEQDPNGIVASGSYNDSLDRPTQIKRGISTGVESQTTFAYDDTARIITTSSDRDALNDNLLVSKLVYDQMGRTKETRQYEAVSNYIVTETQYDALGRPFKTSNPYRPWQSESAVWTTQAFDALGRVTSVTTPDNAVVSTSYSGNSVTVTDQAGKARKSVTDALGRLIEVYEDPSGWNYQTTYLYDVLDSLVKVTQGTQQRFFMYDSLKRLIRARNPEQGTLASLALADPITGNSAWSFGYQYDANSNLTVKTDARNVISTYAYDELNRNNSVSYSDGNMAIGRAYDQTTNGIGRLSWEWQCANANNCGSVTSYNYDTGGRVANRHQQFWINGNWGPPYSVHRAYDLAGNVASQTYPSGHTVNYSYDSAGRTSSFSGDLGDGVLRTYASGNLYSPWGSLSREQYGTSTAVYHKLRYNIRGQLCDVRASNVDDPMGGELGALVNYYGTPYSHCGSGTDNNGNVLMSQTIINSYYMEDRYSYDTLNRLTAVNEWQNATTHTGSQQYDYDRWGNRTIKPVSWGIGINTKQFNVDTATNRLTVPGGQSGVLSYDAAGNLITDTYTGAGAREYDAENRMTRAWGGNNQWQVYTYNADGQRVRRKVDNQETWQVYGFEGELLSEYAANGPAASPQKEYGYRNGQLLVQAVPETVWSDDAVPAGAAVAGDGESWNWVSSSPAPFSGSLAHQSNIVAGLHQHYFYGATATLSVSAGDKLMAYVYLDPSNMPSQIMLQWNDGSWEHRAYWGANNLPWGVDGTDSRRYMGPLPAAGSWVKLEVPASVVGLEGHTVHGMAFSMWGGRATWDRAGKASSVQWLIADHLGTPRMIVDQTGTLANVKRHDYLPFGEELFAGVGGRSAALGYTGGDGVRQQFTSKERDVETGLDNFLARYYSSTQGRFTSPDEFSGGPDELYDFVDAASENPTFYADLTNPQSLNKYQYTYNNPLNMVDPDGHCPDGAGALCWALPKVMSIPGVREALAPAAAGVAVVVIVSQAIKAIPGDNSQGDGSCPACDGYIKRFQDQKAKEQAAQAQAQNQQAAQPQAQNQQRATDNSGGKADGSRQPNKNKSATGQAPGRTSAGRPTDKHGRPLGPSGKPMIHQVNPGSQKRAKDRARNAGDGPPIKHTNPRRGPNHYHPTKKGKKKQDGTHYNYD